SGHGGRCGRPAPKCVRNRLRLRPSCSRTIRISRSSPAKQSRSCRFFPSLEPDRRRPFATPEFAETKMPYTVRLHRVLATTPEKLYRAFLEPDAMAKWLPPNGFAGTVHSLDARVGGTFRMSFRNFTTGDSHSFGGEYTELVPFERIRYTNSFEDP